MLSFSIKRVHISKTSYSKWGRHTTQPLCSSILLFYNHCNREGDVTTIPFVMGTHQGDPLRGTLFTLHSIVNHFPFCQFPSIANNIHIIGPPSIVSSICEHFQTELHAIGLSIQPQKCVAWSPFGLPPNFNTPSQVSTPSQGIKVLGARHRNFHIILHQRNPTKKCSTCGPFPYNGWCSSGLRNYNSLFRAMLMYLLRCTPPSSTFIYSPLFLLIPPVIKCLDTFWVQDPLIALKDL